MRFPLLAPEIRELLQEGQTQDLVGVLAEMHPSDAASILGALELHEIATVMSLLPLEMERDIFNYLDADVQEEYVQGAGKERVQRVLDSIFSDDRAEFLERLDERVRNKLFPLLSNAARQDLLRRGSFADDQVGSFLSTNYAVLNPSLTARQAIEELRRQAPSKETIYYSYVLDRSGKLVGFVSLRDLILAPNEQLVSDIMKTDIVSVSASADQEEAARVIRDYDLIALPVVDEGGRLVGIVTHDDAVDIVEEEAQEDFEKMVGVTGHGVEGMDGDYMAMGVWGQIRRRAPVICLLAVFWVVTASVIQGYEESLKSGSTLLLALLPMVMATGGMVGTQASALVIRSLATGEMGDRHWKKVLWKELRVSAAIGLALAAIAFGDAIVVDWIGGGEVALHEVMRVGLVVAAAMLGHVLSAALLGAVTPIAVKLMRGDPAMISTPAVTAIADLTGATIYLVIVTALLGATA